MIVGDQGPGVVLSARACAWLERYAGLSGLRVKVRGLDPEMSRQLEEIRYCAMAWRGSATGTSHDTEPEPAAQSSQWLTTTEAAELVGISDTAIRKAIRSGRLAGTEVSGRWRLSREDVEHFKAARRAA